MNNPYHEHPSTDYGLTLDFETTNLEHGSASNSHNRVICVSYKWRGSKPVTLVGDIYDIADRLVPEVLDAEYIVAHNAKFELQWLSKVMDISQLNVWDTMIGEYVLAGNLPVRLDLASCCSRYGIAAKTSPIATLVHLGVCPSELPLDRLVAYCEEDVVVTEELQRKQLENEALNKAVLWTRCLVTPALAEMEMRGMKLDSDRVIEEYEVHAAKLAAVNADLHVITGGINPKSAKQVGEFLYQVLKFAIPTDARGNPLLTSGGKPPTDKNSLVLLKAVTPEQRAFLELKREHALLEAAITKNLEFFKGVCEHRNGLFYGQFNQTVTQTHRLSSSGRRLELPGWDKAKSVQFQNFPRRFKPLFKPRNKGWYIVEADGAQLEFRVAAFLGQDKAAMESIISKEDIHSFTASVLTSKGQKTDRQTAKAHTFKPLYGGSSGSKAEKEYYKAFKEKYPGITSTQEGWAQTVLETKKLELPWGMTFYWPSTTMTSTGYITNSSSIYNYPVQSLATAEIIPVCVALLWKAMKAHEMDGFLVNTIHDSVIAEIPPEEVELFTDLVVKVFTEDIYRYLSTVYGMDFNVPLGVEIKVGRHWGEADTTITKEAEIF